MRIKLLFLGLITAIPLPAFVVCLLMVLIRMIRDQKEFGITGIVFVISAGLAVTAHSAMFFYYLIRMQNLKSIDQNHYPLWLLVLMSPVIGQLIFWYQFLWKPHKDGVGSNDV
ncbi:MAG: hypothetical protein FWD53_03805 [Phycisphaerales bacterium]|nr:hypothetical protein [Phycisphaerales bacterium]